MWPFIVCILGVHISLYRLPYPTLCKQLMSTPSYKVPLPEAPHLPSYESHIRFSWKRCVPFSSPPGPARQVTRQWRCLLFRDRCRTCLEMACQASAVGYCTAGGHYLWLGHPHQRLSSASLWSLRGQDRRAGDSQLGDSDGWRCSLPGDGHGLMCQSLSTLKRKAFPEPCYIFAFLLLALLPLSR